MQTKCDGVGRGRWGLAPLHHFRPRKVMTFRLVPAISVLAQFARMRPNVIRQSITDQFRGAAGYVESHPASDRPSAV